MVRQILDGAKTAGAGLARDWQVPDGEYDDGGYVTGDLVEVYDGRGRLRCHIRITEVYETTFGSIPENLWRAEVCTGADDFRRRHRKCWAGEVLTDDTPIVAFHFERADSQTDGNNEA